MILNIKKLYDQKRPHLQSHKDPPVGTQEIPQALGIKTQYIHSLDSVIKLYILCVYNSLNYS